MLNKPSKEMLNLLPPLYATENVPAAEKLIYLHFYFGDCHWLTCEFDGGDLFFGYAVLHGDMQNAEWGYFSLSELTEFSIIGLEVCCDRYWEPIPAGEMELLKGWI